VAWHPRSTRLASLSDLEERKTLILLGMVGAVVAELSGTSQTLAFVIFGIGALLRFRTVLDNPKLTVKAIIVVVVGLACGMGSWVMAVFVTVFSWVLIFMLESRLACRIRIRLADDDADLDQAFSTNAGVARLQAAELRAIQREAATRILPAYPSGTRYAQAGATSASDGAACQQCSHYNGYRMTYFHNR
jgi:hypothetical protein